MLLAIAITYVLVSGSQTIINGPNVSMDFALAKRDLYGSDFLWFRKDGREYVIHDAATLDRVNAMFERARALKTEMKKLKWEMRSPNQRESVRQRQEEIERERDALEADAERRMVPILDEAIRSGVATRTR